MVYLIGASGHAKVVIEILEKQNIHVSALLDANPEIKSLLNYDVYENFPSAFYPRNDKLIITIGNNTIRKRIASSLTHQFISAIHPNANVSSRAVIDSGTVIMAGASINSDVKIGKHVIINTNASVDHDCVIGDFVHLSPNVALGGDVQVGEGTHIGIGTCVIQGIRIGKWCTIGAGAVIIKDIPDGVTVVGNPGRIIK